MPPKKKGKGKGKGKGKKGKKGKKEKDPDAAEEKFKRAQHEIQSLKDHLGLRKEIARRAEATAAEMRQKLRGVEEDLDDQRFDQKSISSDLTRQYKTMQTELGLRIHTLETEVTRLRQQLANTEAELQETKIEKERITREKDRTIEELRMKIDSMEISYDGIVHDALDNLLHKMDDAKQKWEKQATQIQLRHKHLLLEFGLNPLDI
ncbi:dynein regulatory complex protein 12-like [Branchiostoma floridae x Branchiostoma japonicum]